MGKPNKGTEVSIRILCSQKWKRKVARFAAKLGRQELAAEGNMSEVIRRATDLYMRVGIEGIAELEAYVDSVVAFAAKVEGAK